MVMMMVMEHQKKDMNKDFDILENVKKHFVNTPQTGIGHYEPIVVDINYSKEFNTLIEKIPDKNSIELGKFIASDAREMTELLLKEKINIVFKELKEKKKIEIALISMLHTIYQKENTYEQI